MGNVTAKRAGQILGAASGDFQSARNLLTADLRLSSFSRSVKELKFLEKLP